VGIQPVRAEAVAACEAEEMVSEVPHVSIDAGIQHGWERVEVVVTVKAYPSASSKYRETVCVAGIRPGILGNAELIRLYPVPFRSMQFGDQFKKWEIVNVPVRRHPSDLRPESFRPNVDAITKVRWLDTNNRWAQRRPYMEQLPVFSMCELQARQRQTGQSLGVVDPGDVVDMVISPRDATELDDSRSSLAAEPTSLFEESGDYTAVEIPPYHFRYHFRCSDCGPGKLHRISNIDWEVMQAFRNWRVSYGEDSALERIRTKWVDEICGPRKDTLLFSGNMHQHPGSFLILGAWWPPKG
jgi:hypothetical protein